MHSSIFWGRFLAVWWYERDTTESGGAPGKVVFWIVPAAAAIRHGITEKPGAWPAGTLVSALCGKPVKIPCSSSPAMRPRMQGITERCPDCEREYQYLGCPSTVWDY